MGTISKTFPIEERYKLEFRFEAYNLTNSLMWANPNMTVGNSLVRTVHCAGHRQSRPRDAVHTSSACSDHLTAMSEICSNVGQRS